MADPNYKIFQDSIAGSNNRVNDFVPTISSVGDFQKIDGINVLISSIRNLLLTPLGFYPFDPTYGSLLYKKIFEPLDNISIEEIKYEVRERIMDFDDRVKVTAVDIFPVSTDGKAIRVDVSIKRGEIIGTATVYIDKANSQFGLESA